MAVSAKYRWEYRGEGHRSIVVADINNKRVYRMIKRPCRPATNVITMEERLQIQSQEFHQLKLIVDFVANVMAPLLPELFLSVPVLVDVTGSNMLEVGKSVEAVRPRHRKNKEVNPIARFALALPDLCFIPSPIPIKRQPPSISIEIKPKRGFIPTSPHIGKENQIKLEICKYCLHSNLKVERGMRTRISKYCPVDLFSGNPRRMKHALLCLLDVPQNNLRICKNGQEIFGDFAEDDLGEQLHGFLSSTSFEHNGENTKRYLDVFINLIINALLWSPPRDETIRISEDQRLSQTCRNSSYTPTSPHNPGETTHLPTGCVLESILSLQKLDDLDIEKVIVIYKQLKQHFKEHPEEFDDYELDGPYTKDSWPIRDTTSHMTSVQLMVHKIKEFLVSTTVQDCSVMISLKPVDSCDDESCYVMNNPDMKLVDLDGQLYQFAVGIIDLDPKPFDKIPKYFQLDIDIKEAYEKALSTSRKSESS